MNSDFTDKPKANGANQGHTFRPLVEGDGYDEKFMDDPKLLAQLQRKRLEFRNERRLLPV